MAEKTASVKLQLIDQVSARARAISASIDEMNRRIKGIDNAIAEAGSRLFNAGAQLAAFGVAVSSPIKSAMALEDAMADIAKVAEGTPQQFIALRDQLVNMSRAIPIAADQLARIAAEGAAAGVAMGDLAAFTDLAAKASTAWSISAEAAGENIAKISTAMGWSIDRTREFADALNHLSDRTAAGSDELLNFARHATTLGSQVGLSAEQVAALGAALISAGAPADVAGTAFAALTRALSRGESATARQSAAFQALGLDAEQVAKDLQTNAVGTIEDVFNRLRQLPKELQASTANDLFGDEGRPLMVFAENAELLSKNLALVADKLDYLGSVEEEFQKRSETTSNGLQLLANRVRAASIAFGESLLPRVRATAEALGAVADRVAAFVRQNTALVSDVTTAAGAFLTLRVGLAAASLGILLARREMALAAVAGLKLASVINALTVAPLVAGLARARAGLLAFSAAAAISGTASAFSTAIAGMGGAVLALVSPVRILKVALTGLRGAMMLSGVGAAIVAVGAAVNFTVQNFSGLKAMLAGVGSGFMAALGPAAEAIRPVTDGIAALFSIFDRLTGDVGASHAEWRGWGIAVGEAVGGGVLRIVEFTKAVAGLPGLVAESAAAMFTAGSDLIQRLWDGAVAKFDEFITWLSEIPSRIVAAVGRIDLSNLISWPSMPAWLGGGDSPAPISASSTSPAGGGGTPSPVGSRAGGGPVARGLSYVVGEEGPELFTPSASGSITPNDALNAGTTSTTNTSSRSVAVAGPTINLSIVNNLKLPPTGDVEAVARKAAEGIVAALSRQVDDQLNRSTQIAFGSANAYGGA